MIYSVCRILSVMAAWEMRGDCRSRYVYITARRGCGVWMDDVVVVLLLVEEAG